MKLLMFHAERFGYRAHIPAAGAASPAGHADLPKADRDEALLPAAEPSSSPSSSPLTAKLETVALVLVQVEIDDAEREGKLVAKAVRNVKWFAGKRSLNHVHLHSFAHLGGNAAPAAVAEEILRRFADRLESKACSVSSTPFGRSYALDLAIHEDPGAKVFKSI